MNLAQSKTRDVAQEEQIGRRSSIIPEARNTRAPAFQPQAEMRNASRGDGGAQELMRTLGLADRAISDFQQYSERKHAVDEKDNIALGAADQELGRVDEARMAKSEGYRNAVTKGRTVTEFSKAFRDFDEGLRGMIEKQDDVSLDARQAEVQAATEKFFHDFAVDPETKQLKSFMQSPGAMRYLAEEISTTRPKLEAAAMERIEARFNTEAVGHFQQNIVDQATASDGSINMPLALSMLPATVPQESIRKATVTAVTNAAEALRGQGKLVEARRLLDGIIGDKPKPLEVPVAGAPEGAPSSTGSLTAGAPASQAPSTGGRVSFSVLADAVEWQESRGRPGAVSPKGARGTMQTMPGTLRDPGYGVTPARNDSSAELTRVGRDYLQAMLREYNGDLVLALAAYNAGPGRANAWKDDLAGKSMSQKIAAIPFKETRDYVRNIMTRTGAIRGTGEVEGGTVTAPDDPIQVTPGFRLAKADADPITLYEQSNEAPAMPGIEKLGLSGDDLQRLRGTRDQLTAQMRADWTRKTAEEQEHNASGMMLRLYGQGSSLTSTEITEAIRTKAVTPQQGMQLYSLVRQNANQAQSYADRQLNLADRATAKRREEQTAALTGEFVGAILAGRMTAGQARAKVLERLPSIKDPLVQTAVTNAVLGAANDVEQLMVNSAPTREAVRRVTDSRDWFSTRVTQGGHTPAAAAKMMPQVDSILDTAASEIALRVRDGAKPEDAEREVLGKYRPRLMQITAPRPGRK